MARNSRRFPAILLLPFSYGLTKFIKAADKLDFAKAHPGSGYALPVAMARQYSVMAGTSVSGLSFGVAGGIAVGAALGSVVPLVGNLLGGLMGGVVAGFLGATLGALVTKHTFRFGMYIHNRLNGNEDYSMTNTAKYHLPGLPAESRSPSLTLSSSRTILRQVGNEKRRVLRQSANAEVTGEKSLLYTENETRQNEWLNNAVRALQDNPEDPLQVAYAGAELAKSVAFRP